MPLIDTAQLADAIWNDVPNHDATGTLRSGWKYSPGIGWELRCWSPQRTCCQITAQTRAGACFCADCGSRIK